ncbi:hypothetical protein HYN59_08225 [Flavobacterium album]|uniref:Uncharacterized protein n=1 Tax=Flavobacterium album TaxID=2175091 RepID=A0A2S1QXH2_9FLAO|nr:hypothetical protein [Flavobacterium album]AWH85110.1 hypothetical protein HYN59_08225 [Flavobacterium album]
MQIFIVVTKKKGWDGIEGHLNTISEITQDLFIKQYTNGKLNFEICKPHDILRWYINHQELLNPTSFQEIISRDVESIDLMMTNNFKNITSQFVGRLFSKEDMVPTNVILKNVYDLYESVINDKYYGDLRIEFQKNINISPGKLNDKRFDTWEYINNNLHSAGLDGFDEFGVKIMETLNAIKDDSINYISIHYLLLDVIGYSQDNLTKKDSTTMANTIHDSWHAGFATTCDFFILNDNFAFAKTELLYKAMDITTEIRKPQDIVKHDYLDGGECNNAEELLELLFGIFNKGIFKEHDNYKSYSLNFHIFGYFNEILNFKNSELLLFKRVLLNKIGLLKQEYEALIISINYLLGNESYIQNETKENSFYRAWFLDPYLFTLDFHEDRPVMKIRMVAKTKEN